MMTNEARVAAVKERVRAREQLRKQRRTLFLAVGAALVVLVMTARISDKSKEKL